MERKKNEEEKFPFVEMNSVVIVIIIIVNVVVFNLNLSITKASITVAKISLNFINRIIFLARTFGAIFFLIKFVLKTV